MEEQLEPCVSRYLDSVLLGILAIWKSLRHSLGKNTSGYCSGLVNKKFTRKLLEFLGIVCSLFPSELSGIFLAHCQLCLPTNPRMFPKPCRGRVNCGGQCVLLPLSFIPEDYIIEKSLPLCRSACSSLLLITGSLQCASVACEKIFLVIRRFSG